ncbi:MAG: DNA-binding winged helix-turn-helix (wHTH) protein [Paraglaciecola sp.]|jgi:DNA-binding winged helix-turn-helix (wHTH) protein
MACTQSQQSMLVISSDRFIVGLLTGYSVAKNFSFRSVSCSGPLSVQSVTGVCSVIVIDLRSLTPLLRKSHFESLKKINAQYGIPICAIHAQNDSGLNHDLSWVNYCQDADLLAQLDSYISQYVIQTHNLYSEKRRRLRRMILDRRLLSVALDNVANERTINHCNGIEIQSERFSLGQFEIDKNCRAVYRNGQNLSLTGKEFKLFMLLAEVHEQVCSTETIISQLWPDTRRANKSDLYQYMHLLRKKIEHDPDNPQWISTVKGVGYKLNTNL